LNLGKKRQIINVLTRARVKIGLLEYGYDQGSLSCGRYATPHKRPPIKYVTLEGKGVRVDVTVCDRGRSQEHVTSRLYIFIIHIKHEI